MAKSARSIALPASREIETVSEFIEAIKAVSASTTGTFVYRGTRNKSWKTAPGILRADRAKLLSRERDAVRDIQAVHPQEFIDDRSMFDRLVRMQHFQLPTRLMDVTSNPLVALYFATEEVDDRLEDPKDGRVGCTLVPQQRMKYYDSDTVSCIANLANLSDDEKEEIYNNRSLAITPFNELTPVLRLVEFIRQEKPSFRAVINPDELDRTWFVRPKLSNKRIIAQNGAFIIYGLGTKRTTVPVGSAPFRSAQIIIPSGKKADIRAELDMLGINQPALFPEIDRAAGYIMERYKD